MSSGEVHQPAAAKEIGGRGAAGNGNENDGELEANRTVVEPDVTDFEPFQTVKSTHIQPPPAESDEQELIGSNTAPTQPQPLPPSSSQIEEQKSNVRSTSPKPTLTMPSLANLADLTLHSPSSQIIGTPFATNSTRFEYPFPESPSGISSGSGSPPSASHMSGPSTALAALTNPLAAPLVSGSSFPAISTSSSSSHILLSSSPSVSFPLPSASDLLPTYTPPHPKLKAPTNPPVPPSLAKKRPRWSLNILGRRRSSYEKQSNAGSQDSTASSIPVESVLGGHQVGSPLSSPRDERGHKQ